MKFALALYPYSDLHNRGESAGRQQIRKALPLIKSHSTEARPMQEHSDSAKSLFSSKDLKNALSQ